MSACVRRVLHTTQHLGTSIVVVRHNGDRFLSRLIRWEGLVRARLGSQAARGDDSDIGDMGARGRRYRQRLPFRDTAASLESAFFGLMIESQLFGRAVLMLRANFSSSNLAKLKIIPWCEWKIVILNRFPARLLLAVRAGLHFFTPRFN